MAATSSRNGGQVGRRRRVCHLLAALITCAGAGLLWPPSAVGAQATGARSPQSTVRADTTDPMARALAAEDKNDPKAAAVAYKAVLARSLQVGSIDGDRVAFALLGLERALVDIGALDSILPLVQKVLVVRPTDPVAHGIQLRTLVGMGRNDEAQQAFTLWRRAAGNDGAPYREYARLLMTQGRTLAADSLLSDASRQMGMKGALSGETAQLHVALGRWNAAAVSFRDALLDQPYLETAALFGLVRAPAAARDSIRAVLLADPIVLGPRRLLSQLEFSWSEPRRGWQAIRALKADDSTAAAWRDFGERAELSEAWLVARDAWTAVFERRADLESQRRAADAALKAGDAAGALALVRRPVSGDAAVRAKALLGLEIAALGELGRVQEAQDQLTKQGKALDPIARAGLVRPLVTAMLRSGDLAAAKRTMQDSDLLDDDEIAGWMAVYDGELAVARKRLVRAASQRPELVDALGVLARVRVDALPSLGTAFMTLARRDTAGAAAQFTRLADSVGTAAPALLAMAARLQPPPSASTLWTRVVAEYPKSPEAPEALLAWARLLRDAGDKTGAIVRLEQLLVDYGSSALAPQARRDLERLKGQVPPSGMSAW
jgi:tetratricopeptide (TPR) repeat protein